MKLGEPTKFPSESGIELVQEACPVGTLESTLYRHMAEDMSAPAVFVADPGDGYRLLHASASCRYFGNSCETLLHGMPLPAYIPPLTSARLKKLWQEVGEYRTASMETDFCLASGSRIAVEIIFSLLEHDGRELMAGYMRDISERRVLEAERLRLAEEVAGQEAEFRYREIFENVTDGISLLDVVDGEGFRYAGINPALVRMTGLAPKNILGRFVEATLPEGVARKMIANYRRCVEAGNPIQYELELELPGGRKTFRSTLIPVRDGLGYIHRIISLTSDITERKQAEAERGRLIAILEESADFIGSSDMQGNLLYHNRAARRMIGLPDDADLSTMHVSDMHAEWATKLVLETGIPAVLEHGIWRGDNALLHRDGHEIPVSQLLIMHRDADGKPEFMSTIMQDITERKRVEDTLKFIAQRGWMADEEPFLTALARYLGRMLKVDYVIIDKLADDPVRAETVAIYARGDVLPNMQYSLHGTPCNNVMDGGLCSYPANVQQQFPEDALLVEMGVESYAGIPLWDSTGKVIGLIAVMDGKPMRDQASITSMLQLVATRVTAELERERSEQALAESRQFLNQVIETIPDPVFVKDREHRWIRLNQAFCEFIGHPLEALLGKSDYDFFPAQEAEVFWAKDEAVFNSGEENVNEEEFTCNDGITRALVTKKSRYTDDRGQQYLVGIILDITERKCMEAELISQTNFQRTLLNAMCDVGMQLMVVENGRIIHVGNRKLAYQFGYTDAELDAHPAFIDIIHPDDRARVMDYHVRRVAGEAVPTSYDLGLLMRDGERREYEVSAAIVPDTAPIRIITVGKDITERNRIQEAMQRNQTSLEEAQRISHIGSWDVDMVNGVLTWSDETFRIWEIDKAYFGATVEAFLETVHPEDREKVAHAYNESVSNGTEYQIEHRLLFPDGRVKYIAERGEPFYDADGKPLRFVGTALDITERKQMDATVRQREQESSVLVEYSPDLIFRYDKECRRTYANPAVERLTGKSAASLQNGLPSDASVVSEDEGTKLVQIIRQVLDTGLIAESEVEFIAPDGQLHYFHNRYAPEFGPHGEVTGVISIARDITEHKCQQMLEAERQRVFEKMAHGGDLNEILDQVSRYVESSRLGRHCGILLLEEDQNCLYSAATPSFPIPCMASLDGVAVREGSSCCGTAAWLGKRSVVEDIRHHTCPESCQAFACETGMVACWSEPIVAPSGRVLGVVVIYLNHTGVPGDEDQALLRHASHLSAIAIERKRIEQQMSHQASYDPLTGMPNRRLLGDRLREEIAKAERGGYRLAVLFIDLDRFKEVNDTLGHVAGDGLLVEAAQRIRACVRESDTVARLAGDEFVVILPEVGEIVPQNRVAQCIVESMARSFLLGEHNAYISASVGIAGYPQDADNAETLIGCADQAMYAAKEAGRNSFSFFTRGMLERAQQRVHLAGDLRNALGKGQLQVYYQPIIDAVSGRAVKAEALLRWQHPQRGMVSPDIFIPLAEETGAIHEIGDWVFRQAAGVALQWQTLCAMGNDNPALCQISVNMSPRQFIRGNPDVAWVEHLQAIGLNPEAIVIEITEGLLLDDQSDVLNKLQCFHQSGMQLALDDFGTGYSAMAYLKKFNIDYLKIDRSFVRDLETDPGDRAIAEAIVAMAHRLGLKVIAEGVETEGQCAILAAAGCEYVQGYFYAKSMPAEVFLEYVVSSQV